MSKVDISMYTKGWDDMNELNVEQFLKMADELGIDYELNSDDPGFFVKDSHGKETKLEIEDILMVDQKVDLRKKIDEDISNALKYKNDVNYHEVKLAEKFLRFSNFVEVA